MTDTAPIATPDLVAQGVALYAKAEQAAYDLEEALLSLRKLYAKGYANGDLAGGEAIKARTSMISLAGDVAAIHGEIIAMHERDIAAHLQRDDVQHCQLADRTVQAGQHQPARRDADERAVSRGVIHSDVFLLAGGVLELDHPGRVEHRLVRS